MGGGWTKNGIEYGNTDGEDLNVIWGLLLKCYMPVNNTQPSITL